MKSMLYEASSVWKAVEQAWQESGQPSEFSIKILEPGEKGFLWFTKHPAVISISYDPKKQNNSTKKGPHSSQQPNTQGNRKPEREPRRKTTQHDQKDPQRKTTQVASSVQDKIRPTQGNRDKQEKNVQKPRPIHQKNDAKQPTPQNPIAKQEKEQLVWVNEDVTVITQEFQSICSIIGFPTDFATQVDHKKLTITFKEKLLEQEDEEKMFFISMSYILMQFLKKHHKKKFRGYQLMITRQGSSTHAKQK